MYRYEDVGFRPMEQEDLEQVRIIRNDPTTWMYLTSVGMISRAGQQEWFESLLKSKDRAYFACFEMEKIYPMIAQKDLIGFIRTDLMDGINKHVRVGMDVVPEKRRKGWGTKIYHALLRFCFAEWNMNKVYLFVLEGSEVAIKLYKNVGFQEDGRMRQAVYRDGNYKDYIIMSILHEEYKKYFKAGRYNIKSKVVNGFPGG